MCVSEQARSLSSMQPKAVEMDGQRLQGLIDGNKRWLETRRKDPSVYPSVKMLTHYHIAQLIMELGSVLYISLTGFHQTSVHALSDPPNYEWTGPAEPGRQQPD